MEETVYFVGYARLPDIVPAKQNNDKICVGLEVDMDSYIIIHASSTVLTDLGRSIVRSCIEGKNVLTEQDLVVNTLKRRFQGEARKAIIEAFLNAASSFKKYIEK